MRRRIVIEAVMIAIHGQNVSAPATGRVSYSVFDGV